VRVVSLHPDVLVATSAIWQTNCVIVRAAAPPAGDGGDSPIAVRTAGEGDAGAETFVIDSPVLPAELDALPALLEQSAFPPPSGLLATHADWDHLLGRLAFPGVALGCAESTSAQLTASPGAAQRELRAFDERFYVERPRPLTLGQAQALPVPGRCGIGERELELYPADGHTEDGMAIWIPWARVLVAGDYLSTVEPPQLGREGLLPAYLDTLERLRPLVVAAEHVVPGHGSILGRERALGVLEEHISYLSRG
jgi:glyoxylase-like metal-dependent hydrolase (beta-lactamase superfamily II)